MTDELGREELLEELAYAFACSTISKQTYRQIKALIQKPGVTEEWIEKKAGGINDVWAGKITEKDFIRSLYEQMPAKEATVSEEFVETYAEMIDTDPHQCTRESLIGMLTEAGVEVNDD